jgi:hypothetical protein
MGTGNLKNFMAALIILNSVSAETIVEAVSLSTSIVMVLILYLNASARTIPVSNGWTLLTQPEVDVM